jgi:chromate transporter
MLEPLRRLVVKRRGWLPQQEFLDGLALCQILPGPTVVQMATYVGCRLRGLSGALAAAAAFILPGFLLMLGLSAVYHHFSKLGWVQGVSRGLNAMVLALLVQTIWQLGRPLARKWIDWLIAVGALGALGLGANYLLTFLGAALLKVAAAHLAPDDSSPSKAAGNLTRVDCRQRLFPGLAILAAAALALAMLWRWDRVLAQLSLVFLKIGAVSFGGAYVMIPLLQWEVVDLRGWLTVRQFLDGLLLSFVTPGPLMNLATFVGYWLRGWPGAAAATLSVYLPAMAFIVALFPYYQRLRELAWMRPAIQGILAALVGMLALVTGQMARQAITGPKELAILAGAFLALTVCRINLLWVAGATAAISLAIF